MAAIVAGNNLIIVLCKIVVQSIYEDIDEYELIILVHCSLDIDLADPSL